MGVGPGPAEHHWVPLGSEEEIRVVVPSRNLVIIIFSLLHSLTYTKQI